MDHLASGTQKSCVREIQRFLVADIFEDENEDICGCVRGDPLLHATSTTDPRRFARAASRMGRAQWRLSYLRVVRIAPRRTASSFFIERISLGCVINLSTKQHNIMNPNTKKLDGKVAIVTGASKGIGAAIAKQFAAEGAAVVVNYASSKEGADRVVDQIAKRGGKAVAVRANVANKKDIQHLFAEAKKSFGKIDILVNNAGVYEFSPLEEITEQQFHKHFDINVLGLLLASQAGLKHFGPEGGSIINISSGASTLTPPTTSVYSATKGAVDAITRTLAKELGPRKSGVNAV